jgi:hypothetical protein
MKMCRHPHLVRLREVIQSSHYGLCALVMEFADTPEYLALDPETDTFRYQDGRTPD